MAITRQVEFLHVDDLMQLFCCWMRINLYLLGKHGLPVNWELVPPVEQGFGVINDQGVAIFVAESTSFGNTDVGVVAVDFAQAAVVLQGSEVAYSRVAAIQFAKVLQFTQRLQVADGTTRNVDALQDFLCADRREVTNGSIADVQVLE